MMETRLPDKKVLIASFFKFVMLGESVWTTEYLLSVDGKLERDFNLIGE